MATAIARHFAHLPLDDAAEQVATHLQKFWIPAMRRSLRDQLRSAPADSDPLLVAAVAKLQLDEVDHEELVQPSGG